MINTPLLIILYHQTENLSIAYDKKNTASDESDFVVIIIQASIIFVWVSKSSSLER